MCATPFGVRRDKDFGGSELAGLHQIQTLQQQPESDASLPVRHKAPHAGFNPRANQASSDTSPYAPNQRKAPPNPLSLLSTKPLNTISHAISPALLMAIKRIRVARIPLAKIARSEWRGLDDVRERF